MNGLAWSHQHGHGVPLASALPQLINGSQTQIAWHFFLRWSRNVLKPIGLSDEQLRLITQAARPLPPDLRGKFLQLVWEQLKIKTVGVQDAIQRALNYLQPVA